MKRFIALLLCMLMLGTGTNAAETGTIYLYGEQHNQQMILEKELELWKAYYHSGMRHLFVELPYYTAAFLNLWMQDENDDILEQLYDDWQGTAVHSRQVIDFYKAIKQNCPETVFHGTDVGHQYASTGERYLRFLQQNGKTETESWQLTIQNIEQGKAYYAAQDAVYRENKMTENFIREWEMLAGQSVMGIYGSAHTGLQSMNHSGQVACMAQQLKQKYGSIVHSEDLTSLLLLSTPLAETEKMLGERNYHALYFGSQDIRTFSSEYISRDFWRLENAFETLSQLPRTGDVLPYNNYPVQVNVGEVYMIEYLRADGSREQRVYAACGNEWNGLPVTEGIQWKEFH